MVPGDKIIHRNTGSEYTVKHVASPGDSVGTRFIETEEDPGTWAYSDEYYTKGEN